MTHPRGLSPEEAAAWDRLAKTVTPLRRPKALALQPEKPAVVATPLAPSKPKGRTPAPRPAPAPSPPSPPPGLDSHWERRLARAAIQPDFTLDLHGHTLDQAWHRLDAGLAHARAMQARVVLVITGKSRPVDAADRGSSRGAIRAKILDWLAAGPHASAIAAVRPAQRRHGGEGAIYLVLKRAR